MLRFYLLVLMILAIGMAKAENVIKIGVLADHSGSAVDNSTPALLPAHIKPLIDLIRRVGGSIGVFAVRAKAEGGIIRLTIDSPSSAKPQLPNLNVGVFEKRTRLERYRTALNQWNAQEQERLKKADDAIRVFESQLQTMLAATRTDRRSDVWGALMRLDRYFMEALPFRSESLNLALIVSDCLDNTGKQRYTLASTPRVAWVNRTTELPPIFPNPKLFENIEPAVTWLVSQPDGN